MNPGRKYFIEWLERTAASSAPHLPTTKEYLIPALILFSVLLAFFIYTYFRAQLRYLVALNSFLVLGVIASFQACSTKPASSGPSAGPINPTIPPDGGDLGNYFGEGGNGSNRHRATRLYNPSSNSVPPAANAECVNELLVRGLQEDPSKCVYLAEFDNGAGAGIHDIKSALEAIGPQGGGNGLYLYIGQIAKNTAPNIVATHAEPFSIFAKVVDFRTAGQEKVYILNPEFISLTIESQAGGLSTVSRLPENGWFKVGYVAPTDAMTPISALPAGFIRLDRIQNGITIAPNDAASPRVSVTALPEYSTAWESHYNIGLQNTDIPQTPFRGGTMEDVVNPLNGELRFSSLAFAYPRPDSALVPLTLAITYSSQSDRYGPFGLGWTSSFFRSKKFFQLSTPVGDTGPVLPFYFTGDHRYFYPGDLTADSPAPLGPFWDYQDSAAQANIPDIKRTKLFNLGKADAPPENFNLSGNLVRECDPVTKNCLYYFMHGNLPLLIVDQIFLRQSAGDIQSSITTLTQQIDALASIPAGTDSNAAAFLPILQTLSPTSNTNRNSVVEKPGHFVFFVYGAKGNVLYAGLRGKVIRFRYGEPSAAAFSNDGDFLRKVESIVYEPDYASATPANINGTKYLFATNLYTYDYWARETIPGWRGALLKTADSFNRSGAKLDNVAYIDPTVTNLRIFGQLPLVGSYDRASVHRNFTYDFGNRSNTVTHCGSTDLSVTTVTLTAGTNITKKYVFDKKTSLLVEAYAPTENAALEKTFSADIDHKTLRYSTIVQRGSKISSAYNQTDGILESSTQFAPDLQADACTNSGSDPQVTEYRFGTPDGDGQYARLLPYFADLSGSVLPYHQRLPEVHTPNAVIRREIVSEHPEIPNCSGGLGILRDSVSNKRSGTYCDLVADPKGGTIVRVGAFDTYRGGGASRWELSPRDPVKVGDAALDIAQASWWTGAPAPDRYPQEGYVYYAPALGKTEFDDGNGGTKNPPQEYQYRDHLGNLVFIDSALGGVVRNLMTYRFPIPKVVGVLKSKVRLSPTEFTSRVQGSTISSFLSALSLTESDNTIPSTDLRAALGLSSLTTHPTWRSMYDMKPVSFEVFGSDSGKTMLSFSEGQPIRSYSYNADGLLSSVTETATSGIDASGATDTYLAPISKTTNFVYCKTSAQCAFRSETLAETHQLVGNAETASESKIFRTINDFGVIGSQTHIAGGIDENTQITNIDEWGRPTTVETHPTAGGTLKGSTTKTITYTSGWGRPDTQTTSYGGRTAVTNLSYYDEAAGVLASSSEKNLMSDLTITTTFEAYDDGLRPIRTSVMDSQGRSLGNTEIDCDGGECDPAQSIVSTSRTLKDLAHPELGYNTTQTKQTFDGLGNLIENCIGPSGSAINACTTASQRTRKEYSRLGIPLTTKVFEKGMTQAWVTEHGTDSFGSTVFEKETARGDGSDANAGFQNALNEDYRAVFNFTSSVMPITNSFYSANNTLSRSDSFQIGMIFQTSGGNSDAALRFLDRSVSFNHPFGLAVKSASGVSRILPERVQYSSLAYDAGSWVTTQTDKASMRAVVSRKNPSHEESTIGSNVHSVDYDPGLGAPTREVNQHKEPWESTGLTTTSTSSLDTFGRVLTTSQSEGATTILSKTNQYTGAVLTGIQSNFTPSRGQANLLTEAIITPLAGTPETPATIHYRVARTADGNQYGEGTLNLRYSGRTEPVASSYIPDLSSSLNPTDKPLLSSQLDTSRDGESVVTQANSRLDINFKGSPNATLQLANGQTRNLDRRASQTQSTTMTVSAVASPSGLRVRTLKMGLDSSSGGPSALFDINIGRQSNRAGELVRVRVCSNSDCTGTTRTVFDGGVYLGQSFATRSTPRESLRRRRIDARAGEISQYDFWPYYSGGGMTQYLAEDPTRAITVRYGTSIFNQVEDENQLVHNQPFRGFTFYKSGSGANAYIQKVNPVPEHSGVAIRQNQFVDPAIWDRDLPRTPQDIQPSVPSNHYSCDKQTWNLLKAPAAAPDGYGSYAKEDGTVSYPHYDQVKPGLSTWITYDERGFKRTVTNAGTQTLPSGQRREYKREKNYGFDSAGNIAMVEDSLYYRSTVSGEESFSGNDYKLARVTTYINSWMPLPEAGSFGSKRFFLAKQSIFDTGAVSLNGYAISKSNPAIGSNISATIYFIPGPDGRPVYALVGPNAVNQSSGGQIDQAQAFPVNGGVNGQCVIASRCGHIMTYDQMGNLIAMAKDKAGNGSPQPGPEVAYFSPYGLKVIHRINDPNASISGSGSFSIYDYDLTKAEIYESFDFRYPTFPTFGMGGDYFDGLLVEGVYDTFGGRYIRNEKATREKICNDTNTVTNVLANFRAKESMTDVAMNDSLSLSPSQVFLRNMAEKVFKEQRPGFSEFLWTGPAMAAVNYMGWDVWSRMAMKEYDMGWYKADDTGVVVGAWAGSMLGLDSSSSGAEKLMNKNWRGLLDYGVLGVKVVGLVGLGSGPAIQAGASALSATMAVGTWAIGDIGLTGLDLASEISGAGEEMMGEGDY